MSFCSFFCFGNELDALLVPSISRPPSFYELPLLDNTMGAMPVSQGLPSLK